MKPNVVQFFSIIWLPYFLECIISATFMHYLRSRLHFCFMLVFTYDLLISSLVNRLTGCNRNHCRILLLCQFTWEIFINYLSISISKNASCSFFTKFSGSKFHWYDQAINPPYKIVYGNFSKRSFSFIYISRRCFDALLFEYAYDTTTCFFGIIAKESDFCTNHKRRIIDWMLL